MGLFLSGCASPAERKESAGWTAYKEERFADCAKLYGSAAAEFEEDVKPNSPNTPEVRAAREGAARALAERARCLKEDGRLEDALGELESAIKRVSRLAADAIAPGDRERQQRTLKDLREDQKQWRAERR